MSKFWKNFFILSVSFLALITCIQSALAGTVLVSSVLSNSVTLFDEATLLAIKEIKVGFMPHEVVVSPDNKFALVSNFGDLLNVMPGSTLTAIDIANAKVLKTLQLPDKSRPHGIAFISNSQALVTAQGIQSLLVVDFVNGIINKTIPLPGAGAHMVIVDSAKRFAYVANVDSGTICKIDLQNFSVVGEGQVGTETEGLALTPEEDLLLATDRKDNYVAVMRTKDLSLLKKIQTGYGPVRVVMFNHGKSALVTNSVSGNAQVIDIASLNMINTFNTTFSLSPLPVPINVWVKDDQHTAYITNSFANNITLVDLMNGTILKTFTAGYMTDGVAVSQMNAINAENSSDAMFSSGPIDINANIEDVWKIAKNVEDYNRLSQGAITAHVDGELAPGKIIQLLLYKDDIIGKFIPESDETVTVVDNDRKILAWIRKLPDGNFTERYQVLEKISENKTRSTIVLRIPDPIGTITKVTLGKVIDDSFQALNTGIKAEAERGMSA